MSIGILTDSTCDLSPELINKYNIKIIPLSINFGNKVYRDGVDILAEDFYDKLIKTEELPSTSQPSIGLFIEKYTEMADEFDNIISIHLSSKLSGTLESAQVAANQLSDLNIEIINSYSTSMGLGFLVLFAGILIDKGYELKEIIELIKKARENISIYFTVNDLKYLEKGGRIGKAQAFLGSILNFNPLLELSSETGEVLPVEKIRGNKRTRKRVLELFQEKLNNTNRAWIGILSGKTNNESIKFKEMLKKSLINMEKLNYSIETSLLGPVLGCHTGPSVYGFVILKGDFLEI